MTEILQYAILGLGAGGLYTVLALGVLITYRGSGVINFSLGAVAMFGTFVFWQCHDEWGWPLWSAMVAGIGSGVVLGAATYQLIMKNLKEASALTRLVATLAVSVVLQEVALHIWGSTSFVIPSSLPISPFHLFGTIVGLDKVLIFLIAVGLTLALWAIYRFTPFGIVTSAAAENELATECLGYSPDLIATANWAIGGGIAAFAGILLAPIMGLQVGAFTLLIIPALAAAIVGNMQSFALTLVGGVVIGIMQSVLVAKTNITGLSTGAPFLVIILILIVRGRGIVLRSQGHIRLQRLGSGRIRPRLVITCVVAAILFIVFVNGTEWRGATITTLAIGTILLSVVLLGGYNGQLSLAQYALAGLGALVAGRLVAASHLPFLLAVVVAVVAMIPIGLILGITTLRTRGVNLAIATLGFAVAIEAMVFDNFNYTGGISGTYVGSPRIFGLSIDANVYSARYALFCLFCFALCAGCVVMIRRGVTGRRMIAVRANERASESLGISVVRTKLRAFVISAMIAGLGGCLVAFQSSSISYTDFTTYSSVIMVSLAVIGSIGWIVGALIGGVAQTGSFGSVLLNYLGAGVANWLTLITGVLLLFVLLAAPDGLAFLHAQVWPFNRRPFRARETPLPKLPTSAGGTRKVPPKALDLSGVGVRFGGVQAVDGVSMLVQPGEVIGLIGPNGAGKTTLIDAATGYVKLSDGTVKLDGLPISDLSPAARARAGLTRSFQSLELFDDMSVLDNLQAAAEARSPGSLWSRLHQSNLPLRPEAVAAIEYFGLSNCLNDLPQDLSYGSRRLVAIARAVATEPSVLMLDEPAAGLDDKETSALAVLIRRLADDWGMGILLIEHDVDLVMKVCDRVNVLNFGQLIASGTPEEIRKDPAVLKAYLGEDDSTHALAGGDDGTAEPDEVTRTS